MIDIVILFYIIMGFLVFVMITFGTVMLILWNRRKLIFCNFLSDSGQWERQSFKPDKMGTNFTYENEPYEFNIKLCTRDKLNRPIGHYYKGNPKQQLFDFGKGNQKIEISTLSITGKDFMVLMTSKVLRDIFTDDEVMNLLWIIIIVCGIGFCATYILMFAHTPQCKLIGDNETMNVLTSAVKIGISGRG